MARKKFTKDDDACRKSFHGLFPDVFRRETALALSSLILRILEDTIPGSIDWEKEEPFFFNVSAVKSVTELNWRTVQHIREYIIPLSMGDFPRAEAIRNKFNRRALTTHAWNTFARALFGQTWTEITEKGIWSYGDEMFVLEKRAGVGLAPFETVYIPRNGRDLFYVANKLGIFDTVIDESRIAPAVVCGLWTTEILAKLVQTERDRILDLFRRRNSPTYIVIQKVDVFNAQILKLQAKMKTSQTKDKERLRQEVLESKKLRDRFQDIANTLDRINEGSWIKVVPVSNIFELKVQGIFVLSGGRHSLFANSNFFNYTADDIFDFFGYDSRRGFNFPECPHSCKLFNQSHFGFLELSVVDKIARACFPERLETLMLDWREDNIAMYKMFEDKAND